jgi:hypothetical protein
MSTSCDRRLSSRLIPIKTIYEFEFVPILSQGHIVQIQQFLAFSKTERLNGKSTYGSANLGFEVI